MIRLFVLYASVAMIALAGPQSASGILSGTVTGDDGAAISGAVVGLHLAIKTPPRLTQQITDWTATTDASGAFSVPGLPEGDYGICAGVPNSTWLNPCQWDLPSPAATLSASSPSASVAITLHRGAAISIRINDSGQVLAQNEGKTPGAGLLLVISDGSPTSFFRSVPLISQDSGGRNYQIVIPFNTPLVLFVDPTSFIVTDSTGSALAQGKAAKIALLAATGQQVAPITFTVTGIEGN